MLSAVTARTVSRPPSARGLGELIQSRNTISSTLRSGVKATASVPVSCRRSAGTVNASCTTGRDGSGAAYVDGHVLTADGVGDGVALTNGLADGDGGAAAGGDDDDVHATSAAATPTNPTRFMQLTLTSSPWSSASPRNKRCSIVR